MNILSDEKLIEKYQELGDIDSLNQLIQRYLERTYDFFSIRTNNSDDAEDLVQNVFLRITRTINSGKKIKSFQDYFFICCRNIFMDYLRQKKTGSFVQSTDTKEGMQTVELLSFANWNENSGLACISLGELEKALKDCIQLFRTKKIRNVLMDNVLGYSLKEISERNGCPLNTAGSIWHRQKQKFFRCILKKVGLL